jgi:poly(A) polymerase
MTMKPVKYSRDEHSLSRAAIDPDALKIIERLTRNGYKAHLVGGGVRDLLLGKAPKDFDIATDATPRRIKSLFSNSRIIGRRFKLVHVYFLNQKIIEVSTFRDAQDSVEGDGDEGAVMVRDDNKFGTEETDALRRDLTINGLFYDAVSSSIIDYVGGMEDLREGIIRVIGDPDVRFPEDPVRLMRVVRHAARSGFEIEQGCLLSIERNRHLLKQCAAVRVYEELKKDLLSGCSLRIMRLLHVTGLLDLLLPEIDPVMLVHESGYSQSQNRVDELVQAGEEISVTTCLALIALFSRNPVDDRDVSEFFEDEEDLMEHLRGSFVTLSAPRKERERVEGALSLWYDLITKGIEGTFRLSPAKAPFLDDVATLLRVLPASRHDRALFRLLEQMRHLKDDLPLNGRGRGRRRHRPRTRRTNGGEPAEVE